MVDIAQNVIDEIMDKRSWTDDDVAKLKKSSVRDLHNPYLLENALEFSNELLKYKEKKVLIIPDYDADGILSGSLLAGSLSVFGFTDINVYAPRIQTGYGLTIESATEAIDEFGVPDIVLTTDNGSNAIDGVYHLRDQGIPVLVTDHHQVEGIDPGVVNVNPQRPTDTYPFKEISGATVIWKVMQVYAKEHGTERDQRLIDQLIVLAGMSAISDVMPLLDENRYMVMRSVELLQDVEFLKFGSEVPGEYGQIFKGLLAMYEVCNIKGKFNYGFDETTFGFVYGPMLNSPRRMSGSSRIGFDVLLSDKFSTSMENTVKLFAINEERKSLMRGYGEEFLKDIYPAEDKTNFSVGVVPYKHGLIGLLAGQFTNKFALPSIVFGGEHVEHISFDQVSDKVTTLTGSGRSPAWFDLHGALTEIRKNHPEIFNSFGGHAQAAGLSINAKHFELFRELFIESIRARMTELLDSDEDLADDSTVWLDWKQYNSEDLLELEHVIDFIEELKPFGQMFREPAFGLEFSTDGTEVFFMGAEKQHVKFTLPNGLVVIQWNGAKALKLELGQLNGPFTIVVVGSLSMNEFRGNKTMQIIADRLDAK